MKPAELRISGLNLNDFPAKADRVTDCLPPSNCSFSEPQFAFTSPHSAKNRVARSIWRLVWLFLFRPSPTFLFRWRNFLLRMFGARIGPRCAVYPSCRIWAPWNLEMGEESCLSFDVDCYCVDRVRLGSYVTISQYSFLCGATHDYENPNMALVAAPIVVEDGAWVAAGVFVAPGVTIGVGAVVGARSNVLRNVAPWTVVAGNPARFIKLRRVRENNFNPQLHEPMEECRLPA